VETITEFERIAAAHWRGTEEEWLGDWLLRAAEGFTGRANSGLPLGDPGLPLGEALETLTRWYRARGLPPMIAVPLPLEDGPPDCCPLRALDDQLTRRGWLTRPGPAFVMVADPVPAVPAAGQPAGAPPATLPPGAGFRADPVPDEAWLAAYHYRGQDGQPPVMRTVLTSAADQVFLSVRDGAAVLAIARLSFAAGWAGITAVEVAPQYRRAGLGGALTREAFAQAAARGIHRVFLQVEVTNAPARALYERGGFRYSHRYHYRIAPQEPPVPG
jgi:ribosomal protein S18 acetylase RimI-like enzyme